MSAKSIGRSAGEKHTGNQTEIIHKDINMAHPLILASSSQARNNILANAGLKFETQASDLDERSICTDLIRSGSRPKEIARALAHEKALAVCAANPGKLVIGADQLLVFQGRIFSKPSDRKTAVEQLASLAGQAHHLISAVAVAVNGKVSWHHVTTAKMVMREFSQAWLENYVEKYWLEIRHCVGAYRIEKEGARLFKEVEGDLFSIQGLPLFPLLGYLSDIGELP